MIIRRATVAILAAMACGDAKAMEISREQCELIRQQLIISIQTIQHSQNALIQIQFAAMGLVILQSQLEQTGNEGAIQIAQRLAKHVDAISAATKDAAAHDKLSPEGALAFMKVCGPPPS